MTEKNNLRRCEDTCKLHATFEACLSLVKSNVKIIEVWQIDVTQRLSAMEPIVKHNINEIDSMRKLTLGTLVTGLISAVGIISGLVLLILKHLIT